MSWEEMEALRAEMQLGVNAFLATTGIAKSTYYRRKRGTVQRPAPVREQVIERVSELSDEYPALGHRPIAAMLNTPRQQASESTVYRVLKVLGKLQEPCGCQRERSEPPPPPDVERIGLIVGLDYTHWKGKPICNVIEFESRYCLASEVCSRETGQEAKRVMQLAFKRAKSLGLPVQGITVKSDHGSPFRSEVFEDYIAVRKCYRDYSAVGCPQGMGRVERFNRSEKEQSLKWEDADKRDEIQTVCDSYRRFYNHKRPHQALANKTPAQVVRLWVPKVVPVVPLM